MFPWLSLILNIWKFWVHILLKPSLQLYSSLNNLWHSLSLGFERKLSFSSPVATAEFSKIADMLSATLSQHCLLGFEIAQLEFHHLH